MARLLVTGFEPFGGLSRNPSQAVVEALPDLLPTGGSLVRRVLPVDRVAGPATALALVEEHEVDAAVGLGVAVGSTAVQVERVFINLCVEPGYDGPLEQAGADGWFASVPVDVLRLAAARTGAPAVVSNTAGTYVCNALGYQLRQQRPSLTSGFIHLPMTPGEDVSPGTPTLALDQELAAVTAALCALDTWLAAAP